MASNKVLQYVADDLADKNLPLFSEGADAVAVLNALLRAQSLTIAPERLTAVSYGKERPLDPGHDEAAWARNRRAHFVVSR